MFFLTFKQLKMNLFVSSIVGFSAGFNSWAIGQLFSNTRSSSSSKYSYTFRWSTALSILSTAAVVTITSLSKRPLISCAISIVCAFIARRLRCIGLTGGIASGKSTLAAALIEVSNSTAKNGNGNVLVHIDLDAIAREIVQPGTRALKRLSSHFGGDILDVNGALIRAVLREKITRDPSARAFVNSVTHPEIFKILLSRVAWYKWFLGRTVIIDAPLLFESGIFLRLLCCPIIVVACSEEQQLKRLLAREDGASTGEVDAKKLIASQLSLEKKIKMADIVFENSIELSSSNEFKIKAINLLSQF
jgi:dephospho-CoA kinase